MTTNDAVAPSGRRAFAVFAAKLLVFLTAIIVALGYMQRWGWDPLSVGVWGLLLGMVFHSWLVRNVPDYYGDGQGPASV